MTTYDKTPTNPTVHNREREKRINLIEESISLMGTALRRHAGLFDDNENKTGKFSELPIGNGPYGVGIELCKQLIAMWAVGNTQKETFVDEMSRLWDQAKQVGKGGVANI